MSGNENGAPKIRIDRRTFTLVEEHAVTETNRRHGIMRQGIAVETSGRRYLAQWIDRKTVIRITLIPLEGRGRTLTTEIPKAEEQK